MLPNLGPVVMTQCTAMARSTDLGLHLTSSCHWYSTRYWTTLIARVSLTEDGGGVGWGDLHFPGLRERREGELSSVSSYRALTLSGQDPILMASFNLNYPPKALCPHIVMLWVRGSNIWIWGGKRLSMFWVIWNSEIKTMMLSLIY